MVGGGHLSPTPGQGAHTDPIRVLFVEDDADYREVVGDELIWHGFVVRSFADGESLLGSLNATDEADLILLDWALPGGSGIDLLPQLRERGVNLPVVFLTGHSEIAYEDQAFGRGAIDFIDKTRGVDVLVRRLKLAARKPTARIEPEKRIVCGKLTLREKVHRAYWNEVDVGLTASEYGIVQLLASNAGCYKTYREIYDHQYYKGFIAGSGGQGFRTNVRSTIKRIRRKFCEIDHTFSEIENSLRLGYRWRGQTAK